MAEHSDFTGAPDAARWTEGNKGLFHHLHREALHARGQWASVVLPNGTWLEMRILVELAFRPELRVRRTTTPSAESWTAQVKAVQTKLTPDRGRRWGEPHPAEVDAPGVAVTMRALFCNEVDEGKVECSGAGCSEIIESDARADKVLCAACTRGRPVDAVREKHGTEPIQSGLRLVDG